MRDDLLDGLGAPAPRPGFHERLMERAVEAEHASARHWRRVSIALAVVATAAIATASTLAATRGSAGAKTIVDRTLSCATALQGQRPIVWINANVKTKLNPVASLTATTLSDAVTVGTRSAPPQLSVAQAKGGFGSDDGACAASHRRVPLSPSGLPASTTVTSTFIGQFWETCRTADHNRADRTLLHFHLVEKDGTPQSAELAIRNEATGKPVGYVVWTPSRIASWFAPACNAYH
jgi:hypothetical protein